MFSTHTRRNTLQQHTYVCGPCYTREVRANTFSPASSFHLARAAVTSRAWRRATYSDWLWAWQFNVIVQGGWHSSSLRDMKGDTQEHRRFRKQLQLCEARSHITISTPIELRVSASCTNWRAALRLEHNWTSGSYVATALAGHSRGIWYELYHA